MGEKFIIGPICDGVRMEFWKTNNPNTIFVKYGCTYDTIECVQSKLMSEYLTAYEGDDKYIKIIREMLDACNLARVHFDFPIEEQFPYLK